MTRNTTTLRPRGTGAVTSTARLTPAQIRDLERELRSVRARLERSMVAGTPADGSTTPSHSVRRARPDTEGGLAAVLETRTLARHEALVDALRRLEGGTYGLCVSCYEPIPYERLLVMPEAVHCVPCESRV